MFKGHRIIVIGDTHDSPKIPEDRFKWIGQYINEHQPDYIIQIGDFASFDSLSYFQKNSSQAGKLKDAYMVDISSLRSSINLLDKYIDNDNIPRHCTFGNHEHPETSFVFDKNKYLSFVCSIIFTCLPLRWFLLYPIHGMVYIRSLSVFNRRIFLFTFSSNSIGFGKAANYVFAVYQIPLIYNVSVIFKPA